MVKITVLDGGGLVRIVSKCTPNKDPLSFFSLILPSILREDFQFFVQIRLNLIKVKSLIEPIL
jgi:hypothetical protein